MPETTNIADPFRERLNQAMSRAGAGNGPAPVATAAQNPGQAAEGLLPAVQRGDAVRGLSSARDEAGEQAVGTGDHVVRNGECISSIARHSGHFWQTIWDEPANAALKSVRRQPNVLMPGDRVTIPELRPKSEPGATEMRHRFIRRGEPSHFAVRVMDQDLPRANEPFTLIIDGQQTITGVTDPEGKLDVPIPGTARKATLIVGVEGDQLTQEIQLGGLDPVTSWSGVQTRLKNLGFDCDPTGEPDDATLDALNEFRASVGLPAVQDIDEPTRARLQAAHGS